MDDDMLPEIGSYDELLAVRFLDGEFRYRVGGFPSTAFHDGYWGYDDRMEQQQSSCGADAVTSRELRDYAAGALARQEYRACGTAHSSQVMESFERGLYRHQRRAAALKSPTGASRVPERLILASVVSAPWPSHSTSDHMPGTLRGHPPARATESVNRPAARSRRSRTAPWNDDGLRYGPARSQ